MSEHDDDIIEFDFFDEPVTVEQQTPSRMRMPRRRRGGEGGPPRQPIRPPQGFTPLLRLVGLIAFAILVVVLLVFWIQSCQGASKRNAYRNYLQSVGQVGSSSESIGHDLLDALTTPGIKQADLQKKLDALAQREQQDVAKAIDLHPPGPLRPEQQAVVQALQFRVSGLQGLAATFRSTTASKAQDEATVLAQQSQRFVASDVVWADLFKAPAVTELQKQGISGVVVPDSTFLSDAELATPAAWQSGSSGILPRLRAASTGGQVSGGLHGSALESVKALPSGPTLSHGTTNKVYATTDLGFAVAVKDSGNSQEVGIQVTLTIQQSPKPIVKTQKIRVIDPGQTKTVVFKNLGSVNFGTKTTVKVDVAAVPHEANTKNNSASYPVVFSLTP